MIRILAINPIDNLQKTKEILTQQFDGRFNSVSETVTNAKSSLSETINRGKETLELATHQGIYKVSEFAEQAKTAISQTTDQGVQTVQQTTRDAVNEIHQTGEILQTALGNQVQNIERLSNMATDSVQNAVSTAFDNWLNSHPLIAWVLNHPWISVLGLIVAIIILFSLFQVLGSLIKDTLLWLLKSPFKLFQYVLGFGSQSVFKFAGIALHQITTSKFSVESPIFLENGKRISSNLSEQQRLSQILIRLEALQQEQNQLLQDLSKLIKNP